jgi:hypothetical protein
MLVQFILECFAQAFQVVQQAIAIGVEFDLIVYLYKLAIGGFYQADVSVRVFFLHELDVNLEDFTGVQGHFVVIDL